jgi:hypothetical protein
MQHTATAIRPAQIAPTAPAATPTASLPDRLAQQMARDLQSLTSNAYRPWRIHQGQIYAASHQAETWLAEVRLTTTRDDQGCFTATGTPRLGSHAPWTARVRSVDDLVNRLRELEHTVRANYTAARRFRDETGRSPFAGIDDQRLGTLRRYAHVGTYDLPF